MQRGHALAQLRQRHQCFWIGADYPFAALLQPRLLASEVLLAFVQRIAFESCLPAAINLAWDE